MQLAMLLFYFLLFFLCVKIIIKLLLIDKGKGFSVYFFVCVGGILVRIIEVGGQECTSCSLLLFQKLTNPLKKIK